MRRKNKLNPRRKTKSKKVNGKKNKSKPRRKKISKKINVRKIAKVGIRETKDLKRVVFYK